MNITARLSPAPDYLGIGFSGLFPDRRVRAAVSLAGLGAALGAMASQLPPSAPDAALAAVAVGGLAWLVLTALDGGRWVAAGVVVLSAAGGVVTATAPNGIVFTGIAAGNAAVAFDALTALTLAASGVAAFTLTELTGSVSYGHLQLLILVTLAGLVAGAARHEIIQRARHGAQMATAQQGAELARQQAALADERNRLARELHDVLAHTLGALSIQLTALDTLARTGAGPEELLTQIERGHQLVGEGVDEARHAVRALREDSTPLAQQLAQLCGLHDADLAVTGTPGLMRAEVSLALYRLTQEALTNAAKHAPGAAVSVTLEFGPREVAISVLNTSSQAAARGRPRGADSRLRGAGGGYGLPGMRERVRQAGGQFTAGPAGDGGWQVTARIPYDGGPDA